MSFAFFQVNRSNQLTVASKSDFLRSQKKILNAIALKRQPEIEDLILSTAKEIDKRFEASLDELLIIHEKSMDDLKIQLDKHDKLISNIKMQFDENVNQLRKDIINDKLPELEKSLVKKINLHSDELNKSLILIQNAELNKQLGKLQLQFSEINKIFNADGFSSFQQKTSSQLVSLLNTITEQSNLILNIKTDSITQEIASIINGYRDVASKINTENVRLFQEFQATSSKYLDSIRSHQLPQIQRQMNNGMREMYNQIDALFSIYSTFDIKKPMPLFRGWAISPDIAKFIAEIIFETKPKVVLSLGSGVSDLVVGYSLKSNNRGVLYSLEHDPKYALKTSKTITEHNLEDYVKVEIAELNTYTIEEKQWKWYGYDLALLPNKIDLLIIDGPPGSTQKLARYPALPLLYKYLAKGCVIILDDAVREDEKEIMKMWAAKYKNLQFDYLDNEKGAYYIKKL